MRKEHIKSFFLFLLLIIIFNLIAVPFVENHAVSTTNDELGIAAAFKPAIIFGWLLGLNGLLVCIFVIREEEYLKKTKKEKGISNKN